MSLRDVVVETLVRSNGLYEELVEGIDEPALASKLPGVRSNTLGQQLWCVIGARESYARAIVAGAWQGFACSLQACESRAEILAALRSSGQAAFDAVSACETDGSRCRLIIDLVEHEAAHHGQIIRYLYGLDLRVPEGWKKRYALD